MLNAFSWLRATHLAIGATAVACTCFATAAPRAENLPQGDSPARIAFVDRVLPGTKHDPRSAADIVSNPPGDTLRVAWPDLVRLAESHPRFAAALSEVSAARGAARSAGTLTNPSLSASRGRGVPQVTPSNSREWELELALPLGWITQRAFRVGDATAQVEASREQARAERRDVLLELRILFWSLAHDRARVEALETMRSQTAELARLVTRRVEKGEARPSEASRAEIELEKVEIELEAGRSLLNARQREARLWIKGSESHEIEVEANLAEISPVFDLDSVLSVARSRHPAILAARARVRGSASALSLEKFARIPEVEVRGYASGDTERRMRGVGIAFELPVWNWNAGRITQARAQLDAGRHQLEWRTRETETAVVQAHGASVAAKQTALRYRDRILPRSESAATIMEKAYRLGEASLLEVIDSRRVLVETRLQYLAALLQAHIDDSQLDALTGREDTR